MFHWTTTKTKLKIMPLLIIITDKSSKINNGNEIKVAENEIKSFLVLIILLNCSENNIQGLLYSPWLGWNSSKKILYAATYWLGKLEKENSERQPCPESRCRYPYAIAFKWGVSLNG